MPRARKSRTVQEQIDRMVKRIVKQFRPEQIILFGSQARGDATPDSDVDLLVVMDCEGTTREKAIDIQVALHDIVIPTDVIVTTPEAFAWRKEVVGTIEWPAAREGKVLFMPAPPDPLIAVLREWLRKAEHDLTTAAHTLKLGKEAPGETVGFHAQQCVEKYIKALLVFRGTPVPKTHDIAALRALLPRGLRPKLTVTVQKQLTRYAVVLCYPDLGPDVPLAEARKAVAIARRVRKEVRRHLPPAALRRTKP
jgi:HEPN domain-containing protein/predicted nucleotidyltransferase